MIALLFALMLETPTEWQHRTVPTSMPLVSCPNGREPHMKMLTMFGGRHCYWSRYDANDPKPADWCKNMPRVPRVWCPGPK